MFNLFTLSRDASKRVQRIPLSDDVQKMITDAFKAQEKEFDDYSEKEFVFDGKYKPARSSNAARATNNSALHQARYSPAASSPSVTFSRPSPFS